MKRLAISSALFLLFLAAPVHAEKPIATGVGVDTITSTGELRATPEMWFYEQSMREYKDSKMAVRANADLRAHQRMKRLESMKWFGFSNSRPRASSDPFTNDYSPSWTASPNYYPSRWNGMSQP
jgi:hypothetical protein